MTDASAYHITGGRCFDPVQGLRGEPADLRLEDGRIVERFRRDRDPAAIVQVDAAGGAVFAGGLEMHAHIASTSVNAARQIQAATGYPEVVPSTDRTGLDYARLGYVLAVEPAVPPAHADHAHAQLDRIANLDTGLLVLMGNHEPMIESLLADDAARAREIVHQVVDRSRAFGIKAVNPGTVARWRREPEHRQPETIDETISGTRVSPLTILQTLHEAAESLQLSHPVHVHGPKLGEPGNVGITVEMLRAMAGRSLHLAHLQYYAYGRTDEGGFVSDTEPLLDHLRDHPEVTADLGLVAFGPAFTATADLPLEYELYRHVGMNSGGTRPAWFCEGSDQDGFGVMPLVHTEKSVTHAMQWATGLELCLLADSLEQLALTVDHPNGGSFLNYPGLIAQLMSRDERDRQLQRCPKYVREHTRLEGIDRELTLDEIATLTRAAPARALGLEHKGRLTPGADADVAIYPDTPDEPRAMFERPSWVWRRGELVVEPDAAPLALTGRRFTADSFSTSP